MSMGENAALNDGSMPLVYLFAIEASLRLISSMIFSSVSCVPVQSLYFLRRSLTTMSTTRTDSSRSSN